MQTLSRYCLLVKDLTSTLPFESSLAISEIKGCSTFWQFSVTKQTNNNPTKNLGLLLPDYLLHCKEPSLVILSVLVLGLITFIIAFSPKDPHTFLFIQGHWDISWRCSDEPRMMDGKDPAETDPSLTDRHQSWCRRIRGKFLADGSSLDGFDACNGSKANLSLMDQLSWLERFQINRCESKTGTIVHEILPSGINSEVPLSSLCLTSHIRAD